MRRALVLLALLGCADGDAEGAVDALPTEDAAGGDAGDAGTTRGECPAEEVEGRILTCAALERCEEVPLEFQLACCQCDTRYCRPDPACEPMADPFRDDVMPRLDRLCRDCHGGAPNPDDASLALYLGPANPADALDEAQLAANRAEVEGFITRDDPSASPLVVRPTGQSHPVIFAVDDEDFSALVGWIEGP